MLCARRAHNAIPNGITNVETHVPHPTLSAGWWQSFRTVAALVVVIDTVSRTLAATIPMPGRPGGVAITPDGHRAYLAVSEKENHPVSPPDNKVIAIDTASHAITTTRHLPNLFLGPTAITPDGRYAYVPCYRSVAVILIED